MEQSVSITKTNFKYMYWSANQQLTHHTVTGCNMNVGDLLGSGTISGTEKGSYGSLLEITWGGKEILKLPNGEERTFL
jgi:fumarylacetoacetase